MSATQPVEKMSGQDARGVLMQEVFAPVFFQKLAGYGIAPETEEEARTYLSIGQKLLAADGQEQVKKASTRLDFLKQAETDLDREMARRYGTAAPAPAEEEYVKQASELLGDHPLIQQAVEDYNAAFDNQTAAA